MLSPYFSCLAPARADLLKLLLFLSQASVDRLAKFAVANFDYVEDHIRPVVRRYIPGPVQKKSERGGWV